MEDTEIQFSLSIKILENSRSKYGIIIPKD